jgi:hypothetical protein
MQATSRKLTRTTKRGLSLPFLLRGRLISGRPRCCHPAGRGQARAETAEPFPEPFRGAVGPTGSGNFRPAAAGALPGSADWRCCRSIADLSRGGGRPSCRVRRAATPGDVAAASLNCSPTSMAAALPRAESKASSAAPTAPIRCGRARAVGRAVGVATGRIGWLCPNGRGERERGNHLDASQKMFHCCDPLSQFPVGLIGVPLPGFPYSELSVLRKGSRDEGGDPRG